MTRANHDSETPPAELAASLPRPGDSSALKRGAILVAAIAACVFNGCGAARPSKYYQLTLPSDVASVQTGDPAPVTLLVGD